MAALARAELAGCTLVYLATFQWSRRKGADLLLDAFVDAFADERGPPICLVLKVHASGTLSRMITAHVDSAEEQLQAAGSSAKLVLLMRELDEAAMASLYATADVFVLPFRGADWALPLMESMAAGVPVITTRWGNRMDYLTDKTAFLVNVTLAPVDEPENPYYPAGASWAEPVPGALAAALRFTAANREAVRTAGALAREDVLRRWTLDASAHWTAKRLRKLNNAAGTRLGAV